MNLTSSYSYNQDLWQYLSSTDKTIVMYGMGNGADKILDVCTRFSIPVEGVFASSDFVRNRTFRDMPVQSIDMIREKYGDRVNPLQNWWCVDIAPYGVDKATGIRELCAHYGVAETDVIAVGDNLNDMAMIEAFRSYAMAHGNEQLKRVFVVQLTLCHGHILGEPTDYAIISLL